jgi:steroid delta-isomerase-like uncharacterized protein
MQVARMLELAITELWGRNRPELIPQLYAPDVVDHNPVPGQRPGHDGLRDVLAAFHTAFPDLTMELHGTLGDGDRGTDWWTFRGTHTGPLFDVAPTGRRVEFSGIDVARAADGRIVEMWHVEDNLSMLRQLGAVR